MRGWGWQRRVARIAAWCTLVLSTRVLVGVGVMLACAASNDVMHATQSSQCHHAIACQRPRYSTACVLASPRRLLPHRCLCVDPGSGHAWLGSDDGTLRCLLVQRVGRRTCRLVSVRVASAFGAPAVDSGDGADEVDDAAVAAALHDVPTGSATLRVTT